MYTYVHLHTYTHIRIHTFTYARAYTHPFPLADLAEELDRAGGGIDAQHLSGENKRGWQKRGWHIWASFLKANKKSTHHHALKCNDPHFQWC